MTPASEHLQRMIDALGARAEPLSVGEPVERLCARIIDKRFRKWRVHPKTRRRIRAIVEDAVAEQTPLRFTMNFGGYKDWRIETAPAAAWAEFFMLEYHLTYLRRVAALHPPGVSLSFLSNDVIIERADNLPQERQTRYLQGFTALLTAFERWVPEPIALRLVRIVPDLYPADASAAFEADLAEACAGTETRLAEMEPEALDRRLARSEASICWHGAAPWHALEGEARQRRIRESLVLAESIGKVARRRRFDPVRKTIRLFCAPFSTNVPIGTTRASITKFWTGLGVLEQRADRAVPRVLSPRQIAAARPALTWRASGLTELGPAFATVPVHDGRLVL